MAKKRLTEAERAESRAAQERTLANAARTRELAERAQAKLEEKLEPSTATWFVPKRKLTTVIRGIVAALAILVAAASLLLEGVTPRLSDHLRHTAFLLLIGALALAATMAVPELRARGWRGAVPAITGLGVLTLAMMAVLLVALIVFAVIASSAGGGGIGF